MKHLLILLIKLYQLCIGPFIGPACRFYPSCSNYAIEAIKTHGVLRGSLLTIKRLLRCHPWCEGGVDPVPPQDCSSCRQPAVKSTTEIDPGNLK